MFRNNAIGNSPDNRFTQSALTRLTQTAWEDDPKNTLSDTLSDLHWKVIHSPVSAADLLNAIAANLPWLDLPHSKHFMKGILLPGWALHNELMFWEMFTGPKGSAAVFIFNPDAVRSAAGPASIPFLTGNGIWSSTLNIPAKIIEVHDGMVPQDLAGIITEGEYEAPWYHAGFEDTHLAAKDEDGFDLPSLPYELRGLFVDWKRYACNKYMRTFPARYSNNGQVILAGGFGERFLPHPALCCVVSDKNHTVNNKSDLQTFFSLFDDMRKTGPYAPAVLPGGVGVITCPIPGDSTSSMITQLAQRLAEDTDIWMHNNVVGRISSHSWTLIGSPDVAGMADPFDDERNVVLHTDAVWKDDPKEAFYDIFRNTDRVAFGFYSRKPSSELLRILDAKMPWLRLAESRYCGGILMTLPVESPDDAPDYWTLFDGPYGSALVFLQIGNARIRERLLDNADPEHLYTSLLPGNGIGHTDMDFPYRALLINRDRTIAAGADWILTQSDIVSPWSCPGFEQTALPAQGTNQNGHDTLLIMSGHFRRILQDWQRIGITIYCKPFTAEDGEQANALVLSAEQFNVVPNPVLAYHLDVDSSYDLRAAGPQYARVDLQESNIHVVVCSIPPHIEAAELDRMAQRMLEDVKRVRTRVRS